MNLLTHLLLAERTQTSAAGQILGDMVKGRLDNDWPDAIHHGIVLHRAIDSFSDRHPAHTSMRRRFKAPFRRYAGVLVDIGFDHSLARHWLDYVRRPLATFAADAETRVIDAWPARAAVPARRMQGLANVLTGYTEPSGIQRALDTVAGRLARRNPLAEALPVLLAEAPAFDRYLPALLADLEHHVRQRRDQIDAAGPV